MKLTQEQFLVVVCLTAGAAFVGIGFGDSALNALFDRHSRRETAEIVCGIAGLLLIFASWVLKRFFTIHGTK